jgi:hypothetical protein
MNNTTTELAVQVEAVQKLMENLLEGLDESAKKYGAIVRRRAIKSAAGLLTALFIYALSGVSQRVLAVIAQVAGIANISDQAWQKKFVQTIPWLTYLLNETLFETKMSVLETQALRGKPLKLVDGSIVKQEGPNGESIRIHMCYCLSTGCMEEVSVTDHHTAESFKPFNIQPGCIYMADAGFGRGKNLQYVVSKGADALLRVTPNHLSLSEDIEGKKKIDMTKKLETDKDIVDFTCYVQTEKGKYMPVRIVASRLPEDKAEKAVKRKKRNAQRKQNQVKAETLIYAEWVILMTSLGEEYSAADLLAMYRARWQVELLFKRIKQFFRITKVRAATVKHSMALILVWLICWSLTERQSLAFEMHLIANNEDLSRYSLYVTQSFFAHWLKSVICYFWASAFDPLLSLDSLFQRLRNHKDSRPNQFASFHF